MELGERLKEKREEMGISCKQAADIIGVSNWTVSQWEKGNSPVSGKYVGAVEQFIEASRSDLVAMIPEPVKGAALKQQDAAEKQRVCYKVMFDNDKPLVRIDADSAAIDSGMVVFKSGGELVAGLKVDRIDGFYKVTE